MVYLNTEDHNKTAHVLLGDCKEYGKCGFVNIALASDLNSNCCKRNCPGHMTFAELRRVNEKMLLETSRESKLQEVE